MKKIISYFSVLMILITSAICSHDDNEERIKFWKEYYNPKVEVKNQNYHLLKSHLLKINLFIK